METYQEAIDFLFGQTPDFQKVGNQALRYDLSNIQKLTKELGNPHKNLPIIHIAGTNGKGTTAHLIGSALVEVQQRVGFFTSPHLVDFRERIKVGNEFISEQFVIDFVAQHKRFILENNFSFFEITTAMSFVFFQQKKVDWVILEVGLGGRLDATNLVSPVVSAITHIGLDHQKILGHTIEAIAVEKAGIIKPKTPLVLGNLVPKAMKVVQSVALEKEAPIWQENEFQVETNLAHIAKNKDTALKVLTFLNRKKALGLTNSSIKSSWENMPETVFFYGRWTQVESTPKLIVDVGHNVDGIKLWRENIEKEAFQRLYLVLNVSSDRNLEEIIKVLPFYEKIFLAETSHARTLQFSKLQQIAAKNIKIEACKSVAKALALAQEKATPKDIILLGGSFFVVSDYWKKRKFLSVKD